MNAEPLRDDADAMTHCLEVGDLGAPVAACPGWDLRKLAVHTGFVHRWATIALTSAAAPDASTIVEPEPTATGAELAAWMRAGADTLATTLEATAPDAPTWHPFPAEQRAWVWARRQAVETAIHRWDAQHAIGEAAPIDAELAVAGIAECIEIGLPRVAARDDGSTTPHRSVTIVAGGHQFVLGDASRDADHHGGGNRSDGDARGGDRGGGQPDGGLGDGPGSAATIEGSASNVLLVMMKRIGPGSLTVDGDEELAASWLDVTFW